MGNKTIGCIMLVDDNNNDNFFHERAIRKYNPDIRIITYLSATEALEHIGLEKDIPDVIFLDINMPGMTGWEFLDEYHRLTKKQRSMIITMLSTSENPDDLLRAEGLGVFFKCKPLTRDILLETETHYSKFWEEV